MEALSPVIAVLGPLFGEHVYLLLFVALFLAGESIFLPAVYLALAGKLDLKVVVMLTLSANILSDLVSYGIGHYVPEERLRRFVGPRISRGMDAIQGFFVNHSLKVVFGSKFVYGTRTVAHILSGTFKTPFMPYLAVNILSNIILSSVLTGLAIGTKSSVETLSQSVYSAQIAFLVFVVLVIIGHLLIGRIISRTWSR